MSGSVSIFSLGATHPRQDQMISLDDTVSMLEKRFGIAIKPDDVETMREIGMWHRWLSDATSNELLFPAADEASDRAESFTYAKFQRTKLGLIICGGASLPRSYQAQSVMLADHLGNPRFTTMTRDISGACSSWTQGLITAYDVMRIRSIEFAAVGCGEVIASRSNDELIGKNFLMWDDNGACSILHYRPNGNPNYGIIGTFSGCDFKDYAESLGAGSDYILPFGAVKEVGQSRYLQRTPDAHLNNGNALYRYMINPKNAIPLISSVLARLKIVLNDRIFLVPHGANYRLVYGVSDQLGFKRENVLTMLAENGRSNMSSASIPTTLEYYAQKPGFFRKDDIVVLVSFSAGILVDIIVIRIGEYDYLLNAA